MNNLCVWCGMSIPEGLQICKDCEEKTKASGRKFINYCLSKLSEEDLIEIVKEREAIEIIKKRTRTAAYREFATMLTEFYTDGSITDDMHITVGVLKANIADLLKMLERGVED